MSAEHINGVLIFSIVLAVFFIAVVSAWVNRVRRLNRSIRHAQELIEQYEANKMVDSD